MPESIRGPYITVPNTSKKRVREILKNAPGHFVIDIDKYNYSIVMDENAYQGDSERLKRDFQNIKRLLDEAGIENA